MNPECLSAFQELKLGKKTKYIVYTVSKDNTEIIVEKSSTSSSYDEFISDLPEFECRWAVYDFEFEKEGAGKRNKICFYSWCVILYIYIAQLLVVAIAHISACDSNGSGLRGDGRVGSGFIW